MLSIEPDLGFPCSVRCDGCHRAWFYAQHLNPLHCINEAAEVGWTTLITATGQRDLCPRCTSQLKGVRSA